MMKRLVTLSVAAAFAVAGASVYVPKASIRQITASPLRHAELCWTENTNQTATAYIGGKDGAQLRIADPAALRGARIRKLAPGEYAVSASSGFTYDPALDRYVITTTATNTIVITVPSVYDVTDYGYHVEDVPPPGDIAPQTPSFSRLEQDRNVAVITFVKGSAPSAYVEKISVYAKEFGDGEGYNDLTLTTFMLRDSMGVIDFANLRHWAAHLYDGNRGEHWASYAAKRMVRLDGRGIAFDQDREFVATMTKSTNLVVQAGAATAITIGHGPGVQAVSYTYFRITDIDVTSPPAVTLGFAHDIGGFTTEGLGVLYADELTGPWVSVAEGDYAVAYNGDGTGTITIPRGNEAAATGFFKLAYFGAMTDAVRITLRGSVVVRDALILRGTDSKYYRISVSGGTLTATEVTL